MTQENQTSLEDRLLQIGSLSQLGKAVDRTEKQSELFKLYQNIAALTSEGDKQRYKEAYGDIRVSPVEAVRYASEGASSRAKAIKQLYDEKKGKITKEVISSIKKDIKQAEDKAEAASILGMYLTGLYDTPKLDQVTADGYAQEDAAKDLGVTMNFSAHGSIEGYKQKHEGLYARISASNYLKDTKDGKGKVIGFELNEAEIENLMKNVMTGAIMYKNSREIASIREKQSKRSK